eukprot:366036-Chlamydomonas_euryale.AAC.22
MGDLRGACLGLALEMAMQWMMNCNAMQWAVNCNPMQWAAHGSAIQWAVYYNAMRCGIVRWLGSMAAWLGGCLARWPLG